MQFVKSHNRNRSRVDSYTRKERKHSKRKTIVKTIAGPRFYDKKTGEYYGTPDRETIQNKFRKVK